MDIKYDDYAPDTGEKLMCVCCEANLLIMPVTLSYMDGSFPVSLMRCPKCGYTFIPEDLATGKMLRVEKALEDK